MQRERAFIDELGSLWIFQMGIGFSRFDGMSDLRTAVSLHPVFSESVEFPCYAIEEIAVEMANDIIDRYWSDQIEIFLNREI